MGRRVIPAPFGLSPEQQERYEGFVPEVPREAVDQLLREYRCADQEEDLLQEAHIGAAKGVRTFDATKGGAERTWVFFSALHAAQRILRGEKRKHRVVQRMWDALLEHCKGEHRSFDILHDTDEMNRAALTEFRSGVAAAPYVGIGALEPTPGGEGDVVHRETERRCAEGLSQILGDMSERRVELLRLHFADDQPVKDVAETLGEKGYRAELREFHRAVRLVGERMHGLGFRELPPFPRDAAGSLLRESDEAARARRELPTTKP